MTACEYLNRPAMIRREIERKRLRVETLRRLAGRITAQFQEVRVRSSPDPARIQALLADAADEEQTIRLLQESLNRALTDTVIAISRMPDEKLTRLLELRYIDEYSWTDIAEELGYTKRSTFKLHQRALSRIEIPDIAEP